MLAIDLRNAFDSGREQVDNFTVKLLRLIAKADGDNRAKLGKAYPVEVEAVEIYQRWCPYKDAALAEVDWDEITRRAGRTWAAKQARSGRGRTIECESPLRRVAPSVR
jgi:hypothetical protein